MDLNPSQVLAASRPSVLAKAIAPLVTRWQRIPIIVRASIIAVALFILGVTVVYAYDIRYVGCFYGQSAQALLTSGPGGIFTQAHGHTLAGHPINSSGAGGYCGSTACSWYFASETIPTVAWDTISCIDDSSCTITSDWCSGSAASMLQQRVRDILQLR